MRRSGPAHIASTARCKLVAMRLGLVFLPPQVVSDEWMGYANALVVGRSVRVVVGPGRLPHVSLLHVESDDDPADLWSEARGVVPPICSFCVLSLGLLRYDTPYNAPPAAPGTMAWLIIPCSEALRAAERAAIALPFVRRSRVTTSNGDQFQPHATIAIWEGETNPADVPLPRTIVAGSAIEGRLALGIIGANGVYERSLYEV
jgi:hypothetical protein